MKVHISNDESGIVFPCPNCFEINYVSLPDFVAALDNEGEACCFDCKSNFVFSLDCLTSDAEQRRGAVLPQHSGTSIAATLSGLYNCEVCGEEKCRQPGICEDCLTPPTDEQVKEWGLA